MKKTIVLAAIMVLLGACARVDTTGQQYAAPDTDVTMPDKGVGDTLTAAELNQMKAAVNSKSDQEDVDTLEASLRGDDLESGVLIGNNLVLTLKDGGTIIVDVSAISGGSSTDDQQITDVSLSGTTLSITIEDGNTTTLDLSSLQDGAGTDDQTALEVTITDSGGNFVSSDVEGALAENATAIAGKQDALSEVSQAEAEAGTLTTARLWSPERAKQAILALGGSGEAVYLADCSGITSGFCVDTDDDTLYLYNGTSVVEVPTDPQSVSAGDGITISGTGPFVIATDFDTEITSGNTTKAVTSDQVYDALLLKANTSDLGSQTAFEAAFFTLPGGGTGGYVSAPTYSDDTCTAGQWSFDASYIYICEATNQWDRYAVTFAGWSNPSPSTWDMTLAIVDASALGGTWTVNGTEGPYAVGDSPVSVTGLASGAASIAYSGSNLGNCTGTGVTGTADTGPFSVAESDGVTVTCTETASGGSLGTMVASDDFNSQGDSELSDDANWSTIASQASLNISSGIATTDAGATRHGNYYSGATFSNDQYSQGKITTLYSGGYNSGPAVRIASFNFYQCAFSGTEIVPRKVTGSSTRTPLTTATSRTMSVGETVGITVEGSSTVTVRCYVDGTLVATGTDSDSPLTTGKPGWDIYSTGSAFDDWEGGNL